MTKFYKLLWLPILAVLLVGCSQQKNNKKVSSSHHVYPVKVTQVHGHRGDIIINGTSTAPNDSQIVVKQPADGDGEFMNHGYSSHIGKAKAAKVKNNKFEVIVPSAELSSISNGNLKAGNNFSLDLMAIKGKNNRLGVVTDKKLLQEIKEAKIKPYKFKLTHKMVF
ncbi:hypothetical protein [Lactobacillus sp. LL6]|uniref:hypothetical protein n=1 Tax=Lactobacillus sp. LL6 TaxID=2596827 RepID=UPI00118673B4|nr:hypothetical protein [Lactobacillus sp. LL6]TSO25268.1 hypothetical protein FOD82_08495 [Lactobacillus sp. LL6]